MTTNELVAGRELDVKIGKLLGLENVQHQPNGFYSVYEREYINASFELDGYDDVELPHYSTDMAAASLLIETLKPFHVKEHHDDGKWDCAEYRVVNFEMSTQGDWAATITEFKKRDDSHRAYSGAGETMALALCRAWLAYKAKVPFYKMIK